MGTGLLYNLTSDIDADVKGMSPEVEKQVRLKVLSDRIRNHHKNHNGANGRVNSSANRNYSGNSGNYFPAPALSERYNPTNQANNNGHNGHRVARIPKPKHFLDITLPITQETLNVCYIGVGLRFKTSFNSNVNTVEGVVTALFDNKGLNLDGISVYGPDGKYAMGKIQLSVQKCAALMPAPALA